VAARKNRWRNTIVTLIVLLPIAAVVIYTSFGLSDFECEVCMEGMRRARETAALLGGTATPALDVSYASPCP